MALLKKIKAATLMETLVATVIVIVIFMMASLILNNTFSNTIKHDQHQLKQYLYALEYRYQNGNLSLPYLTEFKDWQISISAGEVSNQIQISAKHKETNKELKQDSYAY